jgi:hypothetical protein
MTKRIFVTILGILVGLLILVAAVLTLYPSVVMLQPAYKEAHAICDSITPGMTFDDVKRKVGYLFFSEPATYIDKQGAGQAQLRNDVKGLDTTCIIRFENGRVTSSGMAYVWL